MDRDRDLLFGVLAVQLRRVSPDQLVEVAAAWAADPESDLSQRLVEAGVLPSSDRELIGRLVEGAIAGHHGDVVATLEGFGGEAEVTRSFGGSVTRRASGGVRYSVVETVAPREGGRDSSATTKPVVTEAPGRYTGASERGRGGIGRVLLVHDQVLGRDVALKELLPSRGAGPAAEGDSPVRQSAAMLARFLQEAKVTGQLEHPSIVPVYELGTRRDGRVYYTMKLVRGRSLDQALEEAQTLPARLELLPHLVDLCQAIAYAHSRGVIHRDLKPANVMVGEFGETVVIDWGLAKVRGKDDARAEEMTETLKALELGDAEGLGRTAYGAALGTPLYMPPEQARGELDSVDERSDVYSLGAVLYELLSGKPPFAGSSLKEILHKVEHEPPQAVAELEPDTPPELAAICARAMEKKPDVRYQTAKELAEELQRFLSGALVGAYQYRFSEHLRRFVKRHKALVSTAAGFTVVLLAVLTGSAWWNLKERRRAEREAETAKQVSEFVQSIFQVSDPSEARGNTITARELLDRAAERVDKELATQPLVQARMMDTMGVVYRELGLYEQATALLEKALELRREYLNGNHVELSDSLNNLAVVMQDRGDYDTAERLLREALAMDRRLLGDSHPDLALSLNNLAMLLEDKGDLAAAEPLYREALAINRRLFGDEDPVVATSLNNLASLLAEKGDYKAAEPLAREALAMRRRLLGDDHPQVATGIHNLAVLLMEKGDYAAAEPLCREALAMRRRLLGDEHPLVAGSLNGLAHVLSEMGDYAAAEPLYREALAMRRRLLGDDHPQVATTLDNLARLLQARGDYAAAEPLFREALAMYRRLLGDEHRDVAISLDNLAALLQAKGDYAAAEPLNRQALAMHRRLLGDDHPDVAVSLNNLASLLQHKGDYDGAEPLFREALAIFQKTLPPDHPDLRGALERYASLLRETGRDAEAAELEARAVATAPGDGALR